MSRRPNPLQWIIPRRVTKKDDVFEGIGAKEIGQIAGMIIVGFLIGSILKTFVGGGLMSSIIGVGVPGLFGLAMYAILRPSLAFNESMLTIYKRKKAYKKKNLLYFYQRRM